MQKIQYQTCTAVETYKRRTNTEYWIHPGKEKYSGEWFTMITQHGK